MFNTKNQRFPFARRLALLATLGAFLSPVHAEEGDEIDLLTNPRTSSISFGMINIGEDNQRFGMYRGLSDADTYAFGALDLVRRDDATWTRISARNLGLSTQEFHAEYEKQGLWRIAFDYGQTPRVAPYDIHTKLTGIGTNTLSVNNVSPMQTVKLGTDRYKTAVEASRYFGPEFEFRVNYQHEKKEGTRLFGRRNTGSNQNFLAEPIDTTTQQLDAVLNYTGERLQLVGGYYGAFFDNSNPLLAVTTTDAANIALPPDNSAHQLHLTGAYKFTDVTRAKFKLAYTHATQNDRFITPTAASLSTRTDLGGVLNTTLAQLALTSRPTPKLNLKADLRYEDRDDNTATSQYIASGASTNGFNEPRSLRNESGKFEAAYQLPQGFHLIGGVDAELKERTMAGTRVVGYRARTEEQTYRVELRRTLSESLSGSLSYVSSSRSGSDYRTLTKTDGTSYVSGGFLQPIYIADRDRNKWRMSLDWVPTDALSLQFNAEDSRDVYGPARQTQQVGARSGHAWLTGVDASYTVNDNWKLTAWGTRESTGISQATCTVIGCGTLYSSALNNRVDSFGLGIRGKVRNKLELGGDLMVANDQSSHAMTGTLTTPAAPDITTELISLSVFGIYPVAKSSSVRVDYMLDQRKTDDWNWTGWTYATDSGTVDQHAKELTHFLGMTYRYDF
ncbi:MAG: hypothetical protein A2Z95_05605 [Gallionellales bacterium GWA2_60_18]|nr:MAG: hypothetical protein A2Z95_05605 [Gallionellales bacterium GWA2_60_18]